MDGSAYLRLVFALGVVFALIAAAAWLARRFGLAGHVGRLGSRRRLILVEALALDNRRRLVLVRRDEREHLLLLGGTSDIIVETVTAAGASRLPAEPEGTSV